MQQIPVFKPLLEREELAAAEEALKLGWLGPGSYVGRFEEALARFCAGPERKVVAVSTGHAAIHLALLRMGVGPGDEVISPSFNNIADFQAIRATGAEPVFCDIDPVTLCIDPASAEALIGPRTKVMIATDYACHVSDHDRLAEIAARRGVRLLHDAAHAFGSRHRGRPIGSFSDIAMFSFDPVKTITTIDGGALVVKSDDDVRWLREARLIGMGQPSEVMYQNRRAWTYDVGHIGFRYHLANLHAAMGLAQLAKMERIGETRRATARRYLAELSGIAGLELPKSDFTDIVPFMFYVRVPADRRDAFKAHLEKQGIDHGLHWQPGHWFTFFRECRKGPLPVTEKIAREMVTIPLHSAMPEEDVSRVIAAVSSFFRLSRPGDLVDHDRVTVDLRAGTVAIDGGPALPFSDPKAFQLMADLWLRAGWDAKYVYGFTWLGRPVIQLPDDLMALQEAVHAVQPDVLVEIGVAHGGSLIFYASLFRLLGKGRVIGIDIEIRPHNRAAIEAHPMFSLISLVEGDSIAPATLEAVRRRIQPGEKVMVLLDGLHTKKQVLAELRAYSDMVAPGSYIVAMDGIMARVAGAVRSGENWRDDNPQAAVDEFLASDSRFELAPPALPFNEGSPGLRPTYSPNGWLRRKA